MEDICRGLASSFDGILLWKWDRRFETVLAEFSVDKKDTVRGLLKGHLSHFFDSSNVADGPEIVRAVVAQTGNTEALTL